MLATRFGCIRDAVHPLLCRYYVGQYCDEYIIYVRKFGHSVKCKVHKNAIQI